MLLGSALVNLFESRTMRKEHKCCRRGVGYSVGSVMCSGAILFLSTNVLAQNLFVSVSQYNVPFTPSSTIVAITPGGAQSTFASGLGEPFGLAFNSGGDLFEADYDSGNIYRYTPGGAQSTFASGLNYPIGLAFNSAGNLFEADYCSGNIYEFTPGGAQSTFASGLNAPVATGL